MGIVTEEVEVKPRGAMIQYYRDKGYYINYNCSLIVKVKDLPKKSNIVVQALCDMCEENILHIRYADYNRVVDSTGSYVCKNCSHIKMKQTQIDRYGDIYFKTEEFKNKKKQTCIDKYNVENPMQNSEIMERAHNTNLKKYGYASPSQVPEFKDKIKLTAFEHFGVCNPSKSEEVKEKMRNTNLKKYGVPYTQQSKEVRAKTNETLCKNGTQKTSKQQLYLHSLFGGKINYPISYYAVDICFPEEKIYLEYSGGGHDLRVTLGRLTKEEFDKKEIARNAVIKREGYKKIEIVSKKDFLPSDDILLQILQESRSYFAETSHTWQTYDIDKSMLYNAEHKDGTTYSYGTLRTIKDSDIRPRTQLTTKDTLPAIYI